MNSLGKVQRVFSRSVRWLPIVVATLLVVLTPALARATTAATKLYVDQANPACSDSGSGTKTVPYCSIGAAAQDAVAGQTVLISSGNYAENVSPANSGTSTGRIVYASAPGAAVTVGGGQSHGFTISSRSWITVKGLTITQTTGDGISVTGSSHITLTGNHVSRAGLPQAGMVARGIRLTGTTDSIVSQNVLDHNSEAGVYLLSGTTRITVAFNQLSFNARQFERAAPGVDVRTSGNTVVGNISHDNEDSGIQFYPGSSNNLVIENICYANGDHGIDNFGAPGQTVVGNTVYNNVTSGINVEGGSTNGYLANNITVDNGIHSPRATGNIRVDSSSVSGTRIDFDLVFLREPSPQFTWGAGSYSSLAAFQAATGQEPHGIEADPMWVASASGDFHLLAGSPAIDSANSGAPGELTFDAERHARADDPATPNTGIGPRSYDDRGAYEYQP